MNKTVNEEQEKETFEELHKIQLEILKDFIKVCNKYAIPYFAVNNLAAGSIRYQSFIPCNKEIGVGMLRKDFNRFREVFQKELDKYYTLLLPEKDNHFTYPVPRMQGKEIKVFQGQDIPFISVDERFINIIPFDYIAAGKKKKGNKELRHYSGKNFWFAAVQMKNF